ncbi:SCA7-domain-containing protein [Rhizodiscina lignyota]|uniref:SCA7-domain-containing protein n=1 Tax=Rhizodiscina lignyota TaxID=1504668 RepID=A0A9P4M865_9PEZI|nr:SCA7-domain-containing protein [Rhizodiscina lignyota]
MTEDNIERKAPTSRYGGRGIVSDAVYDKLFSEEDKKPAKIKIKKPGPKQTKPGNWKDSEIITESGSESKDAQKDGSAVQVSSPVMNTVDEKIRAAFPTGKPMEDQPDIVQCKMCKRPVLRNVAPAHIKDCLKKKQEKLQKKKEAKEAKDAAARKAQGIDDDDDKPKGGRKTDAKAGDDESVNGAAKKAKKRKADDDIGKAVNAKKKKKDEPKAKAPKTKGPVDVEKQCGVPLPNGAQCARSLTCKSHSMGAKRAVPGRSLPYDMLLAQYQKKNQAKQQRAAIDANAPLADDFDTHGPVDSDEERDTIMAAITRARPQPLVTKAFISTRSKYQYVRLKEMLHNALGGSRGAGLFATSPSQAETGQRGIFGGSVDAGPSGRTGSMFAGVDLGGAGGGLDGQSHSRRSSMALSAAGARQMPPNLPPPGARKPSLSGQSVASVT